jgi:phosphatidate cytidylyltransferase
MSPAAALESTVFLFYLGIVIGLLVAGGVVLVALRLAHKNVEHAWQAYRGWLAIVPIAATAIFLGRETTIAFFTVVGLLGFREFARATELDREWCTAAVVCAGIVAAGVACLLPDPYRPASGWYDLFMATPVFVSVAILAVPVLRNRSQGQLRVTMLAIFSFVYFGWMWGHVAFLANSRHAYAYLGYLLVAVELSDVAAYLTGKAFGRHALRSNISPRKTWEGSLGALAVSLALPWGLWFTFPHLEWPDLLAIGLIVGVGGQLGDLAVSVIKRDLGIKDMGATIPGHGGILDRIDSLVCAAPLFFHYIRFCHEMNPWP